MPATRRFLDTNILLYAATDDSRKAEIAESLLAENPVISVQVLNEFANTARKKYAASWGDISGFLETVRSLCEVEPLTEATHAKALALAERYQLHIYDANIWAAAIMAGCDTLCSEDMHHGLTIESATLHNPFAA